MGFEVYTYIPTPFRMGGPSQSPLKTKIEEYERIDIGAGYFGILFKNPHTKSWHMGQEDCGALIGTKKSRAALIKMVRCDVASGTPETMKQQIEMGKNELAKADYVSPETWFNHFREETK